MTDEKKAMFPVLITWVSFQPDKRSYKPANPLFQVGIPVRVNLPLTAEYFANSESLLMTQLGFDAEKATDTPVNPILTPAGVRFVIDELESVMMEKEPTLKEMKADLEDDEFFEEVTETETVTVEDEFEFGDDDEFETTETIETDETEEEFKF